ncbi:MAG: type II secretion system protein [Myxococcota bacterium]
MAEPRRARRRRGGFSLIEIMVVIAMLSLLAGALAPAAIQQLEQQRRAKTRATLEQLATALVGRPGSDDFGYLGDMGGLPPTLEDLNSAAGKPAYAFGAPGIGYGYAGPYAPTLRPGTANVFVDAWDLPFQFAGAAQVRSAGPDRTFGNADDLVEPAAAPPTTAALVVRVLGLPSGGGPVETLAAPDANVFVSRSNAGSYQEVAMVEPAGGPGPWTSTGLHLGHHGLRVVGTGSWASAGTLRDVATLHRGTTVLSVTLVQP